MVESRSCVQREGVYRWFSTLTSAQRAEFLYGLLDLCVPIELRFLGSCLEDLARKDYHSLRDAEIKANNPADLSGLTNVTDEVVRSKLLVSLALLGTDNREAAGVLYRTLTHIDTVINNYGLALNDGRTEEQFLLLFTMASNHPAFNFHQKQVLRQQLDHIQDILQASKEGGETAAEPGSDGAAVCYAQPHHHQTISMPQASLPPSASILPNASANYLPTCCWHKNQTREASPGSGPPSGTASGHEEQELRSPPPTHPQILDTPTRNHQEKTGKAVIERVVLRRVTHKSENGSEYLFEVGRSDGFTSSVVRTQQEVAEMTFQLSQVFPDDGLEKFLPQSSEVDTRCLPALPSHVLQHHTVQLFFTSNRPLSSNCPLSPPSARIPPPSSFPSSPGASTCPLTSSSNTSCMVQYRGANRAVYRVASVQPVVSTHSSVLTRSLPHLSSLMSPPIPPPQHTPLPPSMPPLPSRSSAAGGGDTSSSLVHSQPHSYPQPLQHHLHPQTSVQPSMQSLHPSHSQQVPHSHSLPRSQSHPAQLPQSQPNTPEQNGILDWLRKLRLHKYYPVFKQLTMEEFLALTEEDLNKYDLTQGAKKKLKTQLELQKSADREMKMEKRPCSGIARVTPSSHMGISAPPTSTAGELQVEVDGVPHHLMSTDRSSSSGYSCSSWMPLCCDSAFDRTRDVLGRVSGSNPLSGTEKDRFILNSSCTMGSGRPTAQVLPVQTDPAPPHLPSCSSHLPFNLLQTLYQPQPSYPQSVPNPTRIRSSPRKPRPSPLCTDDRTKPLAVIAVGAGSSLGSGVGVAARLENQFTGLSIDGSPGPQEAAVCRRRTGGAVGLMVETSSALTSTSNSLHHVSQPPLLFHLSSSPTGYHICPPTSSSCTSSMSINPTAAGPGNPYYQPKSSPAPPTSGAPSTDQSLAHNASMCVCSSCGCHGNCSPYGALPGYAATGYLQPFSAGPSVFTLGPLLHLSPLIASSSATSPGAPHFSYPMMVPPSLYPQSVTCHDQQQGFGFYQPHGTVGNGGQKRAAGKMSCYNCGGGGHRAEDCKQPQMDSVPQGTFRLKFAPHSQSKDSGD